MKLQKSKLFVSFIISKFINFRALRNTFKNAALAGFLQLIDDLKAGFYWDISILNKSIEISKYTV